MRNAEERDEQMMERIRNVLTTLNSYRAKDPANVRIESLLTQLESVEEAIRDNTRLSHAEKQGFDFNLLEGSPMERDSNLETELYSIRNFVMNAL